MIFTVKKIRTKIVKKVEGERQKAKGKKEKDEAEDYREMLNDFLIFDKTRAKFYCNG